MALEEKWGAVGMDSFVCAFTGDTTLFACLFCDGVGGAEGLGVGFVLGLDEVFLFCL